VLGVSANDPFGDAHEEIDASRHFHGRGGHDDGEHDDQHFAWDLPGRDAESEHQHQQTDGTPEPQADATHAGAHEQGAQDHEELENELQTHG
jgi:hypothetical protein